MCRQPPASERLPSQRDRLAVRDARKEASEAADQLRIANEEKQIALHNRNNEQARMKELDKELDRLRPPTLDGKKGEIPRVKQTQLFKHAEFGVKWLKRFHVLDIPPLIISVLKQVGREKQTDLTWATLMHDGFKTARSALLRKHEEEIGEHLATHVYTADHFSLLRLIGGMSKRLCGLIESRPSSTCTTATAPSRGSISTPTLPARPQRRRCSRCAPSTRPRRARRRSRSSS